MVDILFDPDGLIYRDEANGSRGYGDCACDTARYHHLIRVRDMMGIDNTGLPYRDDISFQRVIDRLRVYAVAPLDRSTGLYIRAPAQYLPPEWGNPITDFSADQHDPLIMAMGAAHRRDLVEATLARFKERWFCYQNKDVPRPYMYSMFDRALGGKGSAVSDMGLWGTVFSRCGYVPKLREQSGKWVWGDPDDVADDINLIHLFMQAWVSGDTFVSKAARSYYAKHRVASMGSTELGHTNKVLGAVAHYYRKDSFGLVKLYQPVIEALF